MFDQSVSAAETQALDPFFTFEDEFHAGPREVGRAVALLQCRPAQAGLIIMTNLARAAVAVDPDAFAFWYCVQMARFDRDPQESAAVHMTKRM